MKIEVTDKDIEKGRPGCGYWCPIALAVSRMIPKYRIYVEFKRIHLCDRGGTAIKVIPIPVVARNFISAFDDGELVQPIEFEIDDLSQ